MVAEESPREISGDSGGPTKTEPAKPALPGTSQKPETTGAKSSWRRREGNHYRTFFSIIAVTGPAVTRDSCVCGEVPYNASARMTASAALERVQERERRWKQARDLIRRY